MAVHLSSGSGLHHTCSGSPADCVSDVIKTRVQTQDFSSTPQAPVPAAAAAVRAQEHAPLLNASTSGSRPTPLKRDGAMTIARDVYRREGLRPFFRGLTVCSVRAFIVNGVQVSSPDGLCDEPELTVTVVRVRVHHAPAGLSIGGDKRARVHWEDVLARKDDNVDGRRVRVTEMPLTRRCNDDQSLEMRRAYGAETRIWRIELLQ